MFDNQDEKSAIVEGKQAQHYRLLDNKVFTLYFYNYYHSCGTEYSLVNKPNCTKSLTKQNYIEESLFS